MEAESVVEIIDFLDAVGVQVWVEGGWGVDALLGEQTRDHADLDVILSSTGLDALREALFAAGFRPKPGGREANFVLEDSRGRELDVHAIDFDGRGYGIFRVPDGRLWPFPPSAFCGRGRIGDYRVRCLSAEAQVQCHGQGYEPAETDLHDMERLQDRFGVVLPLALCRQGGEPR